MAETVPPVAEKKKTAKIADEKVDSLRVSASKTQTKGKSNFTQFNLYDRLKIFLNEYCRTYEQKNLILELKEQLDSGNPNAEDWLAFAVKRLTTDHARELAKEILSSHSSSWWFDKKTDWWVNGPENGAP